MDQLSTGTRQDARTFKYLKNLMNQKPQKTFKVKDLPL